MPQLEGDKHKGLNFTTYLVAIVLTGCLYIIPSIAPSSIGTAYIVIFLLMTTFSGLVWYYQLISTQAALILSIILCMFLVPITPYISNDFQRYLWDGAVFLSGVDPYLTAPNDPSVAQLREVWPTPEEHSKYPTLYPPGGLILFSICAMAGPIYGLWVWKALVTFALASSLILTYKLLECRGALKHFHLVALSPLLLFESQLGVHLDIFCVLGIVAALWCLEKDKIIFAGLIIGLAATIKFLPAIIVGPYLFYLKPRNAFKLLMSSAGTWVIIYLIMFDLGYEPLGLLPTFFEKWRGGAPIYPYLEMVGASLKLSRPLFLALILALALTGFVASAWLAKKAYIEFAIILTLAVPLLLSPILFPWYLMALVPLLALKPNLTLFTAITLTPLSYIVLNRWLSVGIWEQAAWPAQILLAGLIIALLHDLFRGMNTKPMHKY